MMGSLVRVRAPRLPVNSGTYDVVVVAGQLLLELGLEGDTCAIAEY
jgi:hypothetical protein